VAIERMSLPVGKSFDPSNQQHIDRVMSKVAESGRGTGWELQSFDPATGLLTLTRRGLLTQVTKSEEPKSDSYRVELRRGTKATDGEKIAAELESDPQHAGYFVTRFDPYLNQATMSRLSDEERRAREAVAVAMGVRPWDVQVAKRRGGGFTLGLPSTYMPSKHDVKLQEVAEQVVGRFGWYFTASAAKLTAEIVPSEPPMFPPLAPYPMKLLPQASAGTIAPLPIGLALAERGDEENQTAYLDFNAGPHLQLGGVSGAGKSSALNVIIAGALASGAELVICDVPQKAVDFELWRPFVRRGGWGAHSFEENAVALQELYEEGRRRAETLKRYAAKKLAELPPDVQRTMPPVLIVVDEYTGLLAKSAVPKSLPTDHPLRLEAETKNLAIDLISSYVDKIAAEMRFVGFQLVISTQVASTSTGIGTALRTNLTNKMLLGPRATDGNRKLVFRDPASVPEVPDHIKSDGSISRGVGAAELEGQRPFVMKGFFATEEQLIAELKRRGRAPIPEGQIDSVTRPNPSVVRELFPQLDDVHEARREAENPSYGTGPKHYEEWELDPETGKPLKGFERANAARARMAAVGREQERRAQDPRESTEA